MSARLVFPVLVAFWLVMCALLWRAELGGGAAGPVVPVAVVWEKMLTAPDDSFLLITDRTGTRGNCRWVPNIGEELATGKIANENEAPEGMVRQPANYRIDLEGNVAIDEATTRLRFSVQARFTTNHVWQEIHVKAGLRPSLWEIHASAREQKLRLRTEDEAGATEQTFTFAQLSQPNWLLSFGGLPALGLLGQFGLPALPTGTNRLPALGLRWEARQDWLDIGHSKVRVYRLSTRLLDRYPATLHVSRVGEILKAELPGQVQLVNDAFESLFLQPPPPPAR